MNREQKAAAIQEIADHLRDADAVFAVDYRGISVPQAAELRDRLRDAGARFQVVKNTLTERAADEAGAEQLKALLEGPTALTYVSGDVAAAAKALADYARQTDLLPFKGGVMEGQAISADDIRAIARLPSREVLYGQLVGVVASPITGLARTLNALISGLAVQLGQIRDQGLVPGEGAAAAAAAEPADAAAEQAPAEAGTEPTDADEGGPVAETASGDEPPAQETPDPDAGPAGAPEPPQPDQAEGGDDPAETSDNA